MTGVDRRKFLQLGGATVAGLAVGGDSPQKRSLIDPQFPGLPESINKSQRGEVKPRVLHNFLIEPGITRRFDQSLKRETGSSPWAVSSEFESFLPSLLAPLWLDLHSAEKWVVTNESSSSPNSSKQTAIALDSLTATTLDSILRVPLIGVPDVGDVIADVAAPIMYGNNLDVSLDFMAPLSYAELPNYRLGIGGIPLVEIPRSYQSAAIQSSSQDSAVRVPPAITFQGWRLQFRGPETHPLGTCVRTPVKHIHLEVLRKNQRGGYDYVVKFHLGTYRNSGRRCFVLWNNYQPTVCWRTCGPTRGELETMLRWVLIAAAAVLGIALAWLIVAGIAATSAAVLFPVLLLLA